MSSTRAGSRLRWLARWLLSGGVLACLLIVTGRWLLPLGDVWLRRHGWRLLFLPPPRTVTPIAVVVAMYLGLVIASVWTERTEGRSSYRRPPLGLIYGLLLLPVLFIGVFNYVPAASALYHAFTNWDIGGDAAWVGMANFREMMDDPVFRESVWNLLRLGTFVFVVNLTVPFIVAEMIYHLRRERVAHACRVAVVLPMIVPGVVVFMLWKYLYSDAGIVSELLTALGRDDWVRAWLSDPDTALWAVACVGFPFAWGVNVLIYYAGLANISEEVLEAGEIDGLGPGGKILRLHLPLVASQFRLLVILTVIGVVNGFESVLILTQDGGPGYETMVPGLYMYLNGFTYQRMGYACAIGLLMLVFLLGFTLTVTRLLRRRA